MIIHENVSKYFQGFDAFVLSVMQDARVPGLGLAIVRDTEVILEQGYGKRNVAENLEVTPQTLFAIGSATKAFTMTWSTSSNTTTTTYLLSRKRISI
jgi:CubicO group peptidase (beta-lactamase class C family)